MKGRLIQLGFFDAYTNMALDEAIFTCKEKANFPPTLRFYSFKPSALSLGYFQKIGEGDFWSRGLIHQTRGSDKSDPYKSDPPYGRGKRKKPSEHLLDIVRRITGGKAVFHNGELSYSFTAGKLDFPALFQSSRFYEVVCKSIIRGLKFLGIESTLNLQSSNRMAPFCLFSSSKYDVVLGNLSADRQDKKLVGSAQRKRNGVILQQGSIFIKEVDLRSLAENIVQGFEEELGMKFEPGELSKEEIRLSRELRKEKYTTKEWNYKR